MAEPGEVEALGRRLADQHPRVDALVHAAGALSRDYRANAEGTEITVATQVLGPYVLTAALAPSLWRAREISSSSVRGGCTPSRSTSTAWR